MARLTILFAPRNEFDQIKHALNNTALEFVATLVSENSAEESKHTGLLAGELQAKSPNGLHDGDLKLVGDICHETRDLLHETINTGLVSGLEQGGNGKCGDGTVAVGNERFDVLVALIDDIRLERSEAVQDSDCSELGNGAWR